jgi:hypothetical protein
MREKRQIIGPESLENASSTLFLGIRVGSGQFFRDRDDAVVRGRIQRSRLAKSVAQVRGSTRDQGQSRPVMSRFCDPNVLLL